MSKRTIQIRSVIDEILMRIIPIDKKPKNLKIIIPCIYHKDKVDLHIPKGIKCKKIKNGNESYYYLEDYRHAYNTMAKPRQVYVYEDFTKDYNQMEYKPIDMSIKGLTHVMKFTVYYKELEEKDDL